MLIRNHNATSESSVETMSNFESSVIYILYGIPLSMTSSGMSWCIQMLFYEMVSLGRQCPLVSHFLSDRKEQDSEYNKQISLFLNRISHRNLQCIADLNERINLECGNTICAITSLFPELDSRQSIKHQTVRSAQHFDLFT
jgi:hypothetical protein